jgi:hypothetical protein
MYKSRTGMHLGKFPVMRRMARLFIEPLPRNGQCLNGHVTIIILFYCFGFEWLVNFFVFWRCLIWGLVVSRFSVACVESRQKSVVVIYKPGWRVSFHISFKLSFKNEFPFCAISSMLSLKSRNKHDYHLGHDPDLQFSKIGTLSEHFILKTKSLWTLSLILAMFIVKHRLQRHLDLIKCS